MPPYQTHEIETVAEKPRTKKHAAKVLGPRCCRCHDVKKVAPLPCGGRWQCVECFLRPRVLVRLVEQLEQREAEPCATC